MSAASDAPSAASSLSVPSGGGSGLGSAPAGSLGGYALQQRLYRSSRHIVYRGRRSWDGLPVVIKLLATRLPSPSELDHLRHEYAVLHRLAGHGVPPVVALIEGEDGHALVTEDLGGGPLSALVARGACPPAEFPDIALACCQALAAVHDAGVLHGAVSPGNILLLAERTGPAAPRREARLIDLAQAADSILPGALPLPGPEDMPYMAPERSGRIARRPDQRADSYALGAVFYHLLTGRPPFRETDPFDLVHAHLSRPPEPPHLAHPGVPAVLSAIVMKLLAKAPEERYQSLAGLRADLEACRQSLADSGALPDGLVPGAADRTETLRLPARLYGRDRELALLAAAIDRVSGGGSRAGMAEAVLIAGPSGIGKTSLAREVLRSSRGQRLAVVSATFAEFRHGAPFGAVVEAFARHIRTLLGGSEGELAVLRARLSGALGGAGGVLAEVIPELTIILGPQPPVPPLPAVENEARFAHLFRALVEALVEPERPLVLFLDDLHWADRWSLSLLQQLLLSPGLRHVLLIGTYRDAGPAGGGETRGEVGGEVGGSHPLAFLISRLQASGLPVSTLRPAVLGVEETAELLADTLGVETGAVEGLARVCAAKTGGNPFFLSRFLITLHQRGIIAFDRERLAWRWQTEDAAGLAITDNMIDLMLDSVRRLSPAGQRVLQRAACIGAEFDLATLARINDIGPLETLGQLWEALRLGLLEPVGDAAGRLGTLRQDDEPALTAAPAKGSGAVPDTRVLLPPGVDPDRLTFRFLHDRVHKAVYSLIPVQERSLRHLVIGRALLESAGAGELADRLFVLLDQLNRGRERAEDPALRQRIAHLNLEAARRAAAAAAPAAALAYAREGLAALGPQAWQDSPALALDLSLAAAEGAFLAGDRPALESYASLVEAHAIGPAEAARTLELRVLARLAGGDLIAAQEAASAALRHLGLPPPPPTGAAGQALARLRLAVRCHRPSLTDVLPPSLADPDAGEPPPNPRPLPSPHRRVDAVAFSILAAVLPGLRGLAPALHAPWSDRLAVLARRLNTPGTRAVAQGAAAMAAAAAGHPAAARRHGEAAIALAARAERPSLRARAWGMAAWWGLPWGPEGSALLPRLDDATIGVEDVADADAVAHLHLTATLAALFTGAPLEEVRARVIRAERTIQRRKASLGLDALSALEQALDNLMQPGATAEAEAGRRVVDLVGQRYDEHSASPRQVAQGGAAALALPHLLKLILAVLFADAPAMEAARAQVGAVRDALAGTMAEPVALFFASMALARAAGEWEASEVARHLRRPIARFAAWGRCPPGRPDGGEPEGAAPHTHRRLALEAEQARLLGHDARAAEAYDAAVRAAQTAGLPQEEALIAECAAAFQDSIGHGLQAGAYRRHAHALYRAWGARAKAAALEAQWPDLAAAVAATSGDAEEHGALDLTAVLRAAQAISGEIHRPALLDRLMRIVIGVAGAQRGLLFLSDSDSSGEVGETGTVTADAWSIEAEGDIAANRVRLSPRALQGQPPTAAGDRAGDRVDDAPDAFDGPSPGYCRSAVNLAIRTGEAVVVQDAMLDRTFAADPYVSTHRPRSLLCLPLVHQKRTRGLLYLENRLAAGVFTDAQLEVLRLLAAQAVISLENARLYADLQTLNRGLEAQIRERTRQATETSRLLGAALDGMSDALLAFDAENRLLVWNDRALALFHLPPGIHHRGTPLASLVREALDRGLLTARLSRVLAARLRRGLSLLPAGRAAQLPLADGRWFQVRRTPMADGGQVLVFLDITDERRQADEARSAREAAENALRGLRAAQESLVQAEKMASLGQLVAGVAHEISTPVGVTLTAASFLADRAQDVRAALAGDGLNRAGLERFVGQAVESAALMVSNIQRAADLIHGFKQIAVDRSSGERRQFPLRPYVEESVRSFAPVLRRRGVQASVSGPEALEVETYPGALSQVLANLITNALTHAFPEPDYPPERGGALRLDIRPGGDGQSVDLLFSDDGVGIPEAIRPRVFDPFFTTRRGEGGSGLGLNIAFNLVTGLLGGTIAVLPADGPGTTFLVRLPLRLDAPATRRGKEMDEAERLQG